MNKCLQGIFTQFDQCAQCRKEENPLRHVLGGGKMSRPKFAFVFINPTHLNLSSHPEYVGKRRYPFIGVRHFYRFLVEAGFMNRQIVDLLYQRGWQVGDELLIEKSLVKHKVYLTNLVKCSQPHPHYPPRQVIEEQLPLFGKELACVNPKYVVAFGGLVVKILTGVTLRLGDMLWELRRGRYQAMNSVGFGRRQFQVLPCFFPLGHGNPPKALEVLQYLKKRF